MNWLNNMEIHLVNIQIEQFIESLEKQTIAKVLRTLDLLEKFGYELGMPHSKSLHKGLFELRIRGVQEVRLIYVYHHDEIIVLHGFIKKGSKISRTDLNIAMKRKTTLT